MDGKILLINYYNYTKFGVCVCILISKSAFMNIIKLIKSQKSKIEEDLACYKIIRLLILPTRITNTKVVYSKNIERNLKENK